MLISGIYSCRTLVWVDDYHVDVYWFEFYKCRLGFIEFSKCCNLYNTSMKRSKHLSKTVHAVTNIMHVFFTLQASWISFMKSFGNNMRNVHETFHDFLCVHFQFPMGKHIMGHILPWNILYHAILIQWYMHGKWTKQYKVPVQQSICEPVHLKSPQTPKIM